MPCYQIDIKPFFGVALILLLDLCSLPAVYHNSQTKINTNLEEQKAWTISLTVDIFNIFCSELLSLTNLLQFLLVRLMSHSSAREFCSSSYRSGTVFR